MSEMEKSDLEKSDLETLIRNSLNDPRADAAGSEPPLIGLLTDRFVGNSRWVNAFAWMKMSGTLLISAVAAILFAGAETTHAQIGWATLVLVGFIGFAMWWIWYWMVLNRNASLREIKRLELQIAQLAGREAHS